MKLILSITTKPYIIIYLYYMDIKLHKQKFYICMISVILRSHSDSTCVQTNLSQKPRKAITGMGNKKAKMSIMLSVLADGHKLPPGAKYNIKEAAGRSDISMPGRRLDDKRAQD
jgi:hypothetical protein